MFGHRPRLAEPPLRGTVLFVHGLWMNGVESFLIRRRIAPRGLALRVLPYSSLHDRMDSVARRCARQALALARGTRAPVHLLGHSMGGLVVYRTFQLGLLAAEPFSSDACRVVFMGTPVAGSQSARALAQARVGRRMLGNIGNDWRPGGLHERWEFPPRLGLMAGTTPHGLGRLLRPFDGPNDGTIAVAETHMEGASERCDLPVSHTSMCLSAEVADRLGDFFETGTFYPARQTTD